MTRFYEAAQQMERRVTEWGLGTSNWNPGTDVCDLIQVTNYF